MDAKDIASRVSDETRINMLNAQIDMWCNTFEDQRYYTVVAEAVKNKQMAANATRVMLEATQAIEILEKEIALLQAEPNNE